MDFDDDVVNFLSDKGYNPTMGARPVKRAIQNYVENPLSRYLLSGEVQENQNIKAKLNDSKDGIIFEKA